MSKFENKLCPVCRAPFTGEADIVVCPQCGAPHHRVCYLTKNKCALEEYHAQGFTWNGYLPGEEPAPEPESTDPHHAGTLIPKPIKGNPNTITESIAYGHYNKWCQSIY